MGREIVKLSQISQTVGKHYDHTLTSDLAERDDITDNKTQPPLTYGNRQKSKHFPSQHQDMTDYGQNFHVKKYSTSFVAIS
jgi:hypothetical protein